MQMRQLTTLKQRESTKARHIRSEHSLHISTASDSRGRAPILKVHSPSKLKYIIIIKSRATNIHTCIYSVLYEYLWRRADPRRRGDERGEARETRWVARRERHVPRDARERDRCRERPLTRERERRERARRTRVRRDRACPNIGDTHEAKRARPEASTERSQTPRESDEWERQTLWVITVSGTQVSVSNHRHQKESDE